MRSPGPLQPARRHILLEHLIRNLLPAVLELSHIVLQLLDSHGLEFARQQLAALVVLVDFVDLGVVVFEVG